MTAVVRFSDIRRARPYLRFTRAELSRLLGLYSTRVIRGEWRDYAISIEPDRTRFSVFRSSNDMPLFEISKIGPPRSRQAPTRPGRFEVTSRQKQLVQGHSLDDVLEVFERPLGLVTA